MDNGRYIWCRKCDAIHHVTAFDRYPIYALAGGDAEALPANDWRDFMARHAGHRLEAMTATGNDYRPSGSAFDPMGIAYLEVSNGAETLLLRRSRKCIEEPLNYEIVNGRLVQTEMSLEVQEEAIRKEMKLHFCWSPAAPLPDEKINHFVSLFREIVNHIDPASARASQRSDVDENISYCQPDSAVIETLIASCDGYFLPMELASLRKFVETHSDGGNVMALVKRRAVIVEQRPQ
jgi:hypothetical protein